MTPLDRAHAAMTAAPDDPAPRLRYFGLLAASELVLLLEREAEGDRIAPATFPLEQGPYVLAFDGDARLTGFTGTAAPYAALPGRTLARMLAGQGLGLCLNPGDAPHDLIPPEAIAWWANMLADPPEPAEIRPEALIRPPELPAPLIAALDAHLGAAAGLAACAWLCGLREGGETGLLLAFEAPAPGAETLLARTAAEALRFSGLETGRLDVTFVTPGDPVHPILSRLALRIDLPVPEPETPVALTDPDAPPRLR